MVAHGGPTAWGATQSALNIRMFLFEYMAQTANLSSKREDLLLFTTQYLHFSPTQIRIFELFLSCNDKKDICICLNLSISTINTHVQRMGIKANCNSLLQISCKFLQYLLDKYKLKSEYDMYSDSYKKNQKVNIQMASLDDIRVVVKDVLFEAFQEFGNFNASKQANEIEAWKKLDWLDPKKVGALYGKTTNALALWRKKGKGPKYTKSGGRILYRTSDVQEYYEAHLQKTIDQE